MSRNHWLLGAELPERLQYPVSFVLGPGGGVILGSVLLLSSLAVVLLWAAIEERLGLDPDLLSWKSLRWTASALLQPSTVVISTIAAAIIVLTLLCLESFHDEVLVAAWVAAARYARVVLPCSILQREVVSAPAKPRWWRLRWPGWTPLSMVAALEIVAWLVGWAHDAIFQAHLRLWVIILGAIVAALTSIPFWFAVTGAPIRLGTDSAP
jgi:hypothetical protein